MDIIIFDVSHASELTALIVEMEYFYFGGTSVSNDEIKTYLTDKEFSEYSGVTVIRARVYGQFVGFATFTSLYSAPHCSGQAYMKFFLQWRQQEVGGHGAY